MRIGANPRAARAVLALLVGLLAGAWVGGGLVWVFNRSKIGDASGDVAALTLPAADEFDLIPADAAGFVHVRAADLWKTPAFDDYRRIVGKAGDDALKALDDGFVPAPSTLDRVTMVAVVKPGGPRFNPVQPPIVIPPGKGKAKGGLGLPPPPPPPPPPGMGAPGPEVESVFLLTFNAPFDPVKVREANLPRGAKQIAGEHEMWSEPGGMGIAFHGDRTIIVGGEWAVRNLLTQKKSPEGPLAPAIKLAKEGRRHVIGSMNLKAYRPPPNLTRDLPGEANTLWRADALTAGVVVGRGMKVDLRAVYKDAATSEAAEKELRAAAESGRKGLGEAKTKMLEAVRGTDGPRPRPPGDLPQAVGGLFALGALGMLDEWLANPPLERDGPELSASVNIGSMDGAYVSVLGMGAGLLLPAVQKVREAAGRVQEQNNLKQLAMGMHMFHDVNGRLPAAGNTTPPNTPRGRPLLSWRVAMLPFVGEQALYAQFKQDEPWDGPNNIKLLDRMPAVFASPRAIAPPGKTYYQVFTTAESAPVKTMFGRTVGRRMAEVADGLSNTIMIVEAAEPVEWTRPMDLPFDPDDDPPALGLPGIGGFQAALGDGSVRFFPAGMRSEALRVWIGANDGIPNPP